MATCLSLSASLRRCVAALEGVCTTLAMGSVTTERWCPLCACTLVTRRGHRHLCACGRFTLDQLASALGQIPNRGGAADMAACMKYLAVRPPPPTSMGRTHERAGCLPLP